MSFSMGLEGEASIKLQNDPIKYLGTLYEAIDISGGKQNEACTMGGTGGGEGEGDEKGRLFQSIPADDRSRVIRKRKCSMISFLQHLQGKQQQVCGDYSWKDSIQSWT